MTSLFLLCAMALPQSNFPAMWTSDETPKATEVRLLNEFIQKVRPGSDIRLVEDGKEEEVKKGGWQRIPFRWDGRWQIWIKTEKRIRRSA